MSDVNTLRFRCRSEKARKGIIQKAVKKTYKNLEEVLKASWLSIVSAHVYRLEARVREGEQAGFFEHLNTMKLEQKRDHSFLFIKGKDDNLFGNVERIHTLRN